MSASGRRPKATEEPTWRLGEIAVYNKLVSQTQVDECLEIQTMLRDLEFDARLGKILIEKFYIDRITLAALLRAQATQRGQAPESVDTSVELIKFTPTEHEVLVVRVRERKLIQPEELDGCIDIQFALDEQGIDKQLGEICIEKGVLSRDIVSDILARHDSVRQSLTREIVSEDQAALAADGPPDEDSGLFETLKRKVESKTFEMSQELRFGRLVQEKGLATDKDVEECLYIQFRLKEVGVVKRIGEVLVMKGVLQESDVRRILTMQKQKMGRVKWSEFGKTSQLSPADEKLSKVLVSNGLLDQDALGECLFVQRALRDLGLERDLLTVVTEKGFLDQRIIERLQKQRAAVARKTAQAERGGQAGLDIEDALEGIVGQG